VIALALLQDEGARSSAAGRLHLWGELTLSDPWFLVLVPLALLAVAFGAARHRYAAARIPRFPIEVAPSLRQRLLWVPRALSAAGLLLVVSALARPLRGNLTINNESEGVDIVLLFDQSSSMEAVGHESGASRFEIAKEVVAAFATRRMTDSEGAADSVALIGFAGFARMLCPFTLDAQALRAVIGTMEVAPRDLDGTRIGVAIAKAVEVYRDFDATSKVAILLTDGLESENPPITPLEAAQLAAEAGVKVYVVFTGPKEQILQTPLRRIRQEISTEELERIAEVTGARFFHARDASELEDVYAAIESLERRKRTDETFAEHFDLYPRLLLPALCLYLLSWLSATTWARRLP